MSFEEYLQKTYLNHAISRVSRQNTSPQRLPKPLTLESLVEDIGQYSPRVSKLFHAQSTTSKSYLLSSRELQTIKSPNFANSRSQQKLVSKDNFSLPTILSSRNRLNIRQFNLDESLASKVPADISTLKAYRVDTRSLDPLNCKPTYTDLSFESRIFTVGSGLGLAKSTEEIMDNIEKATSNHFKMNVKKHELERIVNGSLKLNVKSPIVLKGHHSKKTRSPRAIKTKKLPQIHAY